MKSLIFSLVLIFSTSAFARQYFQCSAIDMYSSEVMVLNLTTEQGGTLFISSGMQNSEDERILMNIELSKVENGLHTYSIVSELGQGQVTIPTEAIGKSVNHATTELVFNGYSLEYSCFSRIYND